MKKSNKIKELYEWLELNKIQYEVIDEDVIEIPGFGKAFFQDTTKSSYNSIFRKNRDGEYEFNSMENPSVLTDEGICYIVFKFGDLFYYYDLKKEFQLNILKYVGNREPQKHDVPFVNLGVHTPYELLNGSFMIDQWVKKAKYLGHTALGICDANTMAACYTLQKECKAADIKHVFGYSLTFEDEDGNKVSGKIYVQSQKGYRNLLRIQKAIMVDNVENKVIPIEELLNRGEGNVFVFGKLEANYMKTNGSLIEQMYEIFDYVFYQVDLTEYKAERIDIRTLEAANLYFHELYGKCMPQSNDIFPEPILICDNYYLDKSDAKNKVILNKIAEGAAHEQSDEQYFKDADEHFAVFKQLFDEEKWDIEELFRKCCDNTLKIAEGAVAELDTTKNYMPKYDMTPEEKEKYGTTHNMFIQLLEEGLHRLVPEDKIEQYRKQMEYEKYIIESTDNVDYLLVQYDSCNWARRNNILVGCGRGSAAGSLLLYLLGITLIDPIKYDLIFERFLLPERAGLYPADVTVIGQDMKSKEYIKISLDNGKTIKVDIDAQFMVQREGEENPIKLYADELEEGDDILLDNRDAIFTINEL